MSSCPESYDNRNRRDCDMVAQASKGPPVHKIGQAPYNYAEDLPYNSGRAEA